MLFNQFRRVKLLSTNRKNRKLQGKLLWIKQLKICAVGVILNTAVQEIKTKENGTKTEELEAKANTKYLINVVLVFILEGFRLTC